MPQMQDGGVAVENLQNEQMDGDDRIERAFAENMGA